MKTGLDYSIKECAEDIIHAIQTHGSDYPKLHDAIRDPFVRLMERPDLATLGVKRESNHTSGAYQLYYDGEISLRLDWVKKGVVIPPHDHGIWEVLAMWRGKLKHTVYRRIDNQQTPGRAELEVVEDRMLNQGDFVLVAPPADIHTFTGIGDDNYHLNVIGGPYKYDRHYYQPDQKTYYVKETRVTR